MAIREGNGAGGRVVPSFGVHKIGEGECGARTASCIASGMEVDAAAERAEGEGYGGLLVGKDENVVRKKGGGCGMDSVVKNDTNRKNSNSTAPS